MCGRAMLAPTATVKPPLCKGRWHGVSRDGGIGACMGVLGCTRKATIPQSALSRSQLPLHKGAFNSTPIEFILAPVGSNGEGVKSVKKRAALLHVLAFCFFDHNIGVLRGEQPLSRAPRPGSSGTFLVLFWSQKSTPIGQKPMIKGSHRKVVTPAGARVRLCFRLF